MAQPSAVAGNSSVPSHSSCSSSSSSSLPLSSRSFGLPFASCSFAFADREETHGTCMTFAWRVREEHQLDAVLVRRRRQGVRQDRGLRNCILQVADDQHRMLLVRPPAFLQVLKQTRDLSGIDGLSDVGHFGVSPCNGHRVLPEQALPLLWLFTNFCQPAETLPQAKHSSKNE